MVTSETIEAVEVGAPVGPDEAEEAALLAEQRAPGSAAIPARKLSAEDSNIPLPPMDELIQRIPSSTRELMDQLFRAKFVTVKRLPVSAFKTQI